VVAGVEMDPTGALSRTVPGLTKAPPTPPRPRQDGGAPALDGASAAACAGPAGEAQPRDASRQHQKRTLSGGLGAGWLLGRRAGGLARVLQCSSWASCRVRSGVTSTLLYDRSPWTFANFGEGIDLWDKASNLY
jgi:hypothetical protein